LTSAFETKRARGTTAWIAMMSSHEMWLAASRLPPSAGVPFCSKAMPRTPSIFLDHQRMRS